MRRDKFYIIAQILLVAREDIKKTDVMYRCGLSYTQLNRYLDLLTNDPVKMLDIVVEDSRKKLYRTNSKGVKFLERYGEIRRLLGYGNVTYKKR